MNIKILTIILSVLMLVMILDLVRRGKLTFKYAFAWLLISVAAIFSAIFEHWLFAIAYWAGFELPSNFIFFAVLAGFVFLSLLLTIFLCQQDAHNHKMAQKLGILEHELDELKKKSRP